MQKTCCFDFDHFLTILQNFLTFTFYDDVVVHKTCGFDFKQTLNFPHYTMN